MSRLTKLSTALILAVAVFASPLALDLCATSCDLHQTVEASDPTCHHSSPSGTSVGPMPSPCGHDHGATITAGIGTPRSSTTLTFSPSIAATSANSVATPLAATRTLEPFASPPHEPPSRHLSISLRL